MHHGIAARLSSCAGILEAWQPSASWYHETAEFPRALSPSRSSTSASCCAGVIGFQSLAHRSAPKTAMRRRSSRSSRAAIRGKAGKAEEGRRRAALGLAVERGIDRRKAAVDLRLGGVDRHVVEQWMRERVVRDGVSLLQRASHQRGMGQRRCGRARRRTARTHSRLSASSTRPVDPGSGPSSKVSTTSFGEWQRLRKMLATDARIRRRIDDEHALG